MAGICKPIEKDLGKEAKYRVLYSHSNGQITDKCGLFDGTTPNEWNTNNVFYWYNDSDILEIDILEECNIWRCGTKSWKGYKNPLKILKFENNKYVDITPKIEQVTSEIDNRSWEKTISNLDKGRYKFAYDKGLRIDSEWYIEKIKKCKYLLKQSNKYYSIKEDFFDKEKELYLPCERDFEKNGIDDLSELTKDKCIDFYIGKKESIDNGSLFSFSLKNMNSILNIISNNDKKNDQLQIGNRKNLIKISCSSNLIEKGNIETLIDGEKEDNLWLNNGNMNESILFEFPYPVSITGINIIQSFVNQQGIWELCGSNDNNKYVSLNDSIEFNNKMNKFINTNSYKYYKLKQKSSTTSRSSYIYEIEFDIQSIYYLLINQQDKYFTINNNNVIELKEYIKNNDFYIKNGFNISNFSINLIKDYFDNVDDLSLSIFSELDNTELNIKYKLNKPFKPINCFKSEIELIQAEEK